MSYLYAMVCRMLLNVVKVVRAHKCHKEATCLCDMLLSRLALEAGAVEETAKENRTEPRPGSEGHALDTALSQTRCGTYYSLLTDAIIIGLRLAKGVFMRLKVLKLLFS